MNIFLGIIVGALLLILIFFAIIYFSVKKQKNKGDGSPRPSEDVAPKRKGLSDGSQVVLSVIAIFLFLIFGNLTNFLGIFKGPWWMQVAVIFVFWRSIWFVIAPLGQKLRVEPIKYLLNILYAIAIIAALAGYLGWKSKASAKEQDKETKVSTPPIVIYHDSVNVRGAWTALDEIPDMGEKFIFEVPDTTTKLMWQYEDEYGRKEVPLYKRGTKQIGGMDVDGPNETRARAQIKTKGGNTVTVVLTVK